MVLDPALVMADTAPSPALPPQDNDVLADIVVTAQRQTSSVQRTPLAITAVSGEGLGERGITDLNALTQNIPNVSFSRIGGDARLFIRGVGLDSAISGADGRVAVYTDEVVNARPQGALASLFDLDRIEVLRGPQGTLYGRNATAGAVNIISNDPTRTLSGYASATLGDYSLVRTEGAISGPLSDTAAARLAFQSNDRTGFGENILTGNDVDNEHNRAARAKFLLQPSDILRIMIVGDYRWERDAQGGFSFVRATPGNVPVDIGLGFATPSNPRDRAGADQKFFQENYGVSVNTSLELGSAALTSITAYRTLEQSNQTSIDGTTSDNSALLAVTRANQFSQELRLLLTAGRLDLLVGGYYFHERNLYQQWAGLSGVYFGLPARPILEGTSQGGTQRTDAYAGFAQGTVHITDKLGVDIGGRYSYEKRSIDENFQVDLSRPYSPDNPPLSDCSSPIACRNTLSHGASWSSFDPKFALHYQFTDAIMGYASYSRGFKSGGFNFGGLQPPFNPEKLTDYELGLKADLLNRRLRVDAAAFYYNYDNLQVNLIEGLALVTRNAAQARVYGAEAEITAVPVDDLRMALNFSWLHSEYLEYSDTDPVTGLLTNLSGNQLTYAPNYKIVGDLGYTFHPRIGDVTPRVEVSWTDWIQLSQFNVPYQAQAPVWDLNLYLDVVNRNGWSVSAYARNVTDHFSYVSEVLSAGIFGIPVVGIPNPPRTFGVTVTKRL